MQRVRTIGPFRFLALQDRITPAQDPADWWAMPGLPDFDPDSRAMAW